MQQNIDSSIINAIIDIIGKRYVITNKEDMEGYTRDETPNVFGVPDIVVKPKNKYEIAEIVKLAYQKRFPIIARGAGTGLSGGAIPINGGCVISMERLNNIIEIDKDNMIAVVEPGVITSNLQNRVIEMGLYYPVDPSSSASSSIGGNIAENAGGLKTIRYGTTKDYILGMEFVDGRGNIISYGGKLYKNVAGYNLHDIICGSEGTLGIVVKAYLKLIPYPPYRLSIVALFKSLKNAGKTIIDIINKNVSPSMLEFMDELSIDISARYLQKENIFKGAGGIIISELEGNNEDELFERGLKIEEVSKQNGAYNIMIAQSKRDRERLWEIRRITGEAVKYMFEDVIKEDIVVPISNVVEFVSFVKDLSDKYKIPIICFGHGGDGNIHVNMLKEKGNTTFDKHKAILLESIIKKAIEFGGSITGEHGVGIMKRELMPYMYTEEEISLMKAIKLAFDPANILNPGKIFL